MSDLPRPAREQQHLPDGGTNHSLTSRGVGREARATKSDLVRGPSNSIAVCTELRWFRACKDPTLLCRERAVSCGLHPPPARRTQRRCRQGAGTATPAAPPRIHLGPTGRTAPHRTPASGCRPGRQQVHQTRRVEMSCRHRQATPGTAARTASKRARATRIQEGRKMELKKRKKIK